MQTPSESPCYTCNVEVLIERGGTFWVMGSGERKGDQSNEGAPDSVGGAYG